MSLVLNVEILGEYKNLSKATKGAEDTFKKLGTKFATIGKNIAKVTAGIGLGLGAAVVSQIKPAIDAASDLSEATNAVTVSFGDAAEGVLALGDNAARGLGLSKTELFGIATQFSSFAKTIAGDGGDLVGVVDQISNRGADFASVFNLEVGDALAKFQSGLAGSSEPLRAYGIDLSAATVEAYALQNGITDGSEAMTESEKVIARYGALMEQTDMVTGDFTNTSDGLANQQRIMKATLEDTRAEIGEKFMPILQDVQTFILERAIPAFQNFWGEMTDPNGEAMKQLEALGYAWEQFASTFGVASSDITSQQVFKWLGDSMVSVIKMATHMATFVGQIFEGMSKIISAGFGLGAVSMGLRGSGIAQVAGAGAAAQRAANAIKFADEYIAPSGADRARTGAAREAITINMNINRAQVDAQNLINDINRTLQTQGSTVILR